MKLQANKSYKVLKDFCLWGCYLGIDLLEGQIICTGEEYETGEVLDVEIGPWVSVEVLTENDYTGLLEELS